MAKGVSEGPGRTFSMHAQWPYQNDWKIELLDIYLNVRNKNIYKVFLL